jgi:hypothetical protein
VGRSLSSCASAGRRSRPTPVARSSRYKYDAFSAYRGDRGPGLRDAIQHARLFKTGRQSTAGHRLVLTGTSQAGAPPQPHQSQAPRHLGQCPRGSPAAAEGS